MFCLRHPDAKPQRSHLGTHCPECLRESFENNAHVEREQKLRAIWGEVMADPAVPPHDIVFAFARRAYDAGQSQDWAPLAKALFQIEHDPKITDQAWFDFQGKAQRLIAIMASPST